ncbi:MAG: flagellar hook-basal body protein [Anaerolineae bacterium]|nr:flagellar hook-basal body protein [Anaerolineae bacterium]
MIRGLYTSAAGMLSDLFRHETIVHNLANLRTVGYKADRATVTDFPALLLTRINGAEPGPEIGRAGTGVSLAALTTNFNDGPLKLTDHPFDFAISGDGFFRLQTPNGVRYTRDGRFHRDVDGRFITAEGYPVLGANGPITLPEGQLTATPNGQLFVNDAFVDQLSLARFDDPANILKDGETTFTPRGPEPQLMAANEMQVHQGYLEESNVDASQVVTEMMSVLRAYQASQRLVQFQDQINGQAVADLGRV